METVEQGQGQGTPVSVYARPVQVRSPAPTEVAGSVPGVRHEMHSEGAAVSGGGQGRWVYEMQGRGEGRDGAYELGSGR